MTNTTHTLSDEQIREIASASGDEALAFVKHAMEAEINHLGYEGEFRIRFARAVIEAHVLAQPSAPEERIAPVQGYTPGIPWSLHLEAYDAYRKKYGKQQALIEGGCRGGFGTGELDMFIPGWRDKVSEIGKLKQRIKELEASQPSQQDWTQPLIDEAKGLRAVVDRASGEASQQEVRVATALSDAIERITRDAIEQLKRDLNKVPTFFNGVNKDVRETLSIAHVNILNLPAMIDAIKRDHEIITQAVSALKSAPISKQDAPPPTMSQFASKADYDAAVGKLEGKP